MIDYSRLEQAIYDGITRGLAADRENARNERAAMKQCQAQAKKTRRRCSRPAVPGSSYCETTQIRAFRIEYDLTEGVLRGVSHSASTSHHTNPQNA